MFFLCLSLIGFLLSAGCYLIYKFLVKNGADSDWVEVTGAITMISCIFGCVLFTIPIIKTMAAYSDQINDKEELKKLNKYEQIYLLKSEVLTKKFAGYLLELYPKHEKDIYDKIKPQEIDIYLAKYPELKSSETIKLLTEQVRTLQNDYYSQALLKADVVKKLIFRTKNPWTYYFLIPKYKEEQAID